MTANRSYCASQKQPATPSGMLKFPIPCFSTTAYLRMSKNKRAENLKIILKKDAPPLDRRAERVFTAAGFPAISDTPKQLSSAARRSGLSGAAFRGTESARCGEREPRGHPSCVSTSRAARAPVQLPGCTRTCASRPHPAERVRSLSPLPPVKRYKIEQKPARRRALPRPPRLRSPSLPGLASRLRSAAHSSRHVQPGAGPPARPPPPRSPIPPPLSAWVGSGRGGQAARRGSAPLPSSRRRDWGAGRRGRGEAALCRRRGDAPDGADPPLPPRAGAELSAPGGASAAGPKMAVP